MSICIKDQIQNMNLVGNPQHEYTKELLDNLIE